MKDYYLYPRRLCLLLLLACAVGMRAQSYLQIWYDSDKSVKQTAIPASGTVKGKIDVQDLSQGLHTIFMRVKSSDSQYPYSPISSTSFLKFITSGTSSALEYWFDDDFANLASFPIDMASDTMQVMTLDMSDEERFPVGIHQINMRVVNNGGIYSPTYSSLVLRVPSGTGEPKLEYWFDDEVSKSSTLPIAIDTTAVQKFDIDLGDLNDLPLGIHKLSMRVARGNQYSPVYNSLVLRVPDEAGDPKLEYWFDDEISKSSTLPLAMDSTAVQKFDLDLGNLHDLPLGIHKLSMRVARGNQYSPVYSAPVLRLRGGVNNKLTYWLDDDYANRHHLFTTGLSTEGAYFKTKLDLSTASPGMHRFHFCISNKDAESGTVYEMPILVTRRYNNQTDVTIVNQSYWLNDADAVVYAVTNPKSLFTQTYNLNPANYEVGQYAFHVQYKNSAEVWSEQNITYFYKEAETGRLRVGMMPTDPTAVTEAEQADYMCCSYNNGTIYVDCQSPKLASTGVVQVFSLSGKLLARQNVGNADGIHAEFNVGGNDGKVVIVRLLSGSVNYSKKMLLR